MQERNSSYSGGESRKGDNVSTLTVSAGYKTIEEEFEASLRRAFVDHKCDYIVLYDRRQQFLFESAAYGQEKGWLTAIEEVELDEQSTEWRLRLTPEGRQHFGLFGLD
jgi:hypothetical protein